MKRLLWSLWVLLSLGVSPTWAGQYEDGVAAHERGDYVNAMRLLRPLALQGNAAAQTDVGIMHMLAQGVSEDYEEALKWFRLSAEKGVAAAQSNLGAMYERGWGVPQDYKEAAKWYRLAAAQGAWGAQIMLGAMYANGRGVAKDYVRAHMWFNLTAAQGNSDAVRNRDLTAQKMTSQQIAKAQEMARRCKASKYKQCD